MDLNDRQKLAVNTLADNVLLLASAGTGKTKTVVQRVINIINQGKALPSEVLCLTFTNRACKEIKTRLVEELGETADSVVVRTFHSFCYDVIKLEARNYTAIPKDFVVIDDDDSKEILHNILRKMSVSDITSSQLYNFMCLVKEAMTEKSTLDSYDKAVKFCLADKVISQKIQPNNRLNFYTKNGAAMLDLYNKTLINAHSLDYMDLMYYVRTILDNQTALQAWSAKFKYIIVDEVQDTNMVEYLILRKLFVGSNVMLCGDGFQTIYNWRGSNPTRIFEDFRKNYKPTEIVLNKNYRATKMLGKTALEFLNANFKGAVQKFYGSEYQIVASEVGEKAQLNSFWSIEDEAKWIYNKIDELDITDYSRVAILTRANNVNERLSKVFTAQNSQRTSAKQLPFILAEEFKFFKRTEIKDVLAFMKWFSNKFDKESLKRLLLKFCHGIGEKTIADVENHADIGISLIDFVDPVLHEQDDPFDILLEELASGNVVVFDVESTGTDTAEDEIIQIAGIKVNHKGEEIETFERFLTTTRSVGSSEKVHGFSDDFLKQKGEKAELVLADFANFIQDSVIVGHNVSFDINILFSQMLRCGLEVPVFKCFYDTLDMSRRFYPELTNHKLETLSEVFDVAVKSSHDALDDIRATKDVMLSIINNKIIRLRDARIAVYDKYREKFIDASLELNDARECLAVFEPAKMVRAVVDLFKIKSTYAKEPTRQKNIDRFIELVDNLEFTSSNYRDRLAELLKFTSLSTSEMDLIIEKKPKVPIITIHQAKGLEFDYVFIAGMHSSIFPSYFARKSGDIREEIRLFYVALTRAKKMLFVTAPKTDFYGYEKQGVSEFYKTLLEINQNL